MNMEISHKELGRLGELKAAEELKKRGLHIIETNYRFGRGELDIIAKDGDTLVFVEVKSRLNLEMGDPVYGVTDAKVKQIKKIAELYLFEKNIEDVECRFDVVTVLFENPEDPEIVHLPDAF